MQGGEDLHYSDKDICEIISKIKKSYPDCAITLSLGEKSKETYQSYFNAGADRYLLRHETATEEQYPSARAVQNIVGDITELLEYIVDGGDTPPHIGAQIITWEEHD
jgi:biotin synthase-like enzyme